MANEFGRGRHADPDQELQRALAEWTLVNSEGFGDTPSGAETCVDGRVVEASLAVEAVAKHKPEQSR